VKTGIHFLWIVPCFRRDGVWIPAGVYPHENGGRNDIKTLFRISDLGFRVSLFITSFFSMRITTLKGNKQTICQGIKGASVE